MVLSQIGGRLLVPRGDMMQIYIEYRNLAGRESFYFGEVGSVKVTTRLDRPEIPEIWVTSLGGLTVILRIDRVDRICGYGKTVPEYNLIDRLKKLIEPPAQEGRELEESRT